MQDFRGGWDGWNRTSTSRVKVCCPTTRLHPSMTGGNPSVFGQNRDTRETRVSLFMFGVDNRARTDGLQSHNLAL